MLFMRTRQTKEQWKIKLFLTCVYTVAPSRRGAGGEVKIALVELTLNNYILSK
ncbi:hypothetical protein NSTC731_06508 [Nostoc sp. DSM 114167]|jgi:hypothetical protein